MNFISGFGGFGRQVNVVSPMFLVPGCVAYWDLSHVSVVVPAQPNGDMTTQWTRTGLGSATGGQADPFGGSAAFLQPESAGTGYHFARQNTASMIEGPCTVSCWFRSYGGRDFSYGDYVDSVPETYLSAGGAVTGYTPGTVVTTTTGSGGWYFISTYSANLWGAHRTAYFSAVGGALSFSGDVAKGFYSFQPTILQVTANNLANRFDSYAADLANGTVATQAFVLRPGGADPGGAPPIPRGCVWSPDVDLGARLVGSCTASQVLTALNSGAFACYLDLYRLGTAVSVDTDLVATASAGNTWTLRLDKSTNTLRIACGTALTYAVALTAARHSVIAAQNGTTATLWVDGVNVASGSISAPGTATSVSSRIQRLALGSLAIGGVPEDWQAANWHRSRVTN